MRKRCLSEPNMLSLEYFYSHNKENAEHQLNLPIQTPPPYTGLVNCADQFSLASLPLVCLSTFQLPRFMLPRHNCIDTPRQQHCVLTCSGLGSQFLHITGSKVLLNENLITTLFTEAPSWRTKSNPHLCHQTTPSKLGLDLIFPCAISLAHNNLKTLLVTPSVHS